MGTTGFPFEIIRISSATHRYSSCSNFFGNDPIHLSFFSRQSSSMWVYFLANKRFENDFWTTENWFTSFPTDFAKFPIFSIIFWGGPPSKSGWKSRLAATDSWFFCWFCLVRMSASSVQIFRRIEDSLRSFEFFQPKT